MTSKEQLKAKEPRKVTLSEETETVLTDREEKIYQAGWSVGWTQGGLFILITALLVIVTAVIFTH